MYWGNNNKNLKKNFFSNLMERVDASSFFFSFLGGFLGNHFQTSKREIYYSESSKLAQLYNTFIKMHLIDITFPFTMFSVFTGCFFFPGFTQSMQKFGARDRTHATALTQAAAVTMLNHQGNSTSCFYFAPFDKIKTSGNSPPNFRNTSLIDP